MHISPTKKWDWCEVHQCAQHICPPKEQDRCIIHGATRAQRKAAAAMLGARGGAVTSGAKTEAARANGSKGGRPSIVPGPYVYCKAGDAEQLSPGQIDRAAAVEAGYETVRAWLDALARDGRALRQATGAERKT